MTLNNNENKSWISPPLPINSKYWSVTDIEHWEKWAMWEKWSAIGVILLIVPPMLAFFIIFILNLGHLLP